MQETAFWGTFQRESSCTRYKRFYKSKTRTSFKRVGKKYEGYGCTEEIDLQKIPKVQKISTKEERLLWKRQPFRLLE